MAGSTPQKKMFSIKWLRRFVSAADSANFDADRIAKTCRIG